MISIRLPGAVVRSLVIAGLALLASLAIISWQAIDTGNRLLFPELAKKAMVQAEQVRGKIAKALDLGIPPEGLVGTRALFETIKANDGDIAFIAMTDAAGSILFVHGVEGSEFGAVRQARADTSAYRGILEGQAIQSGFLVTRLPLISGTFFLGYDEHALVRPLADNIFDIAIVVVVTLLLAFEVMLLVVTVNFTQPAEAVIRVLRSMADNRFDQVTGFSGAGEMGSFIRRLDSFVGQVSSAIGSRIRSAREPTVVGVRLLAFLFVFAEELGRPFLPGYVAHFAAGVPALDGNIATGLVVGLHMSVVALFMPVATMLYARIGRVRLYALGAIVATAGLAGTGLAAGYWDLLAWRALSAIGYATTFIACQGFVLEATRADNRAKGTAMMVGGITLADICGPAFGGVFAERIGQSATFLVAAGVATVAALAVVKLMARNADHEDVPRRVRLRDFAVAFANRRLLGQIFLAALPAKLLLTGFLFYLLPVYLLQLGQGEGDVGRVVMVYGLAMMVGSPLFASLTDRWRNYGLAVSIGGFLSVAMMLVFPFVQPEWVVIAATLAVAAFGLGQSMSITAQVSLVVSLADEGKVRQGQAPELTVLRFVERLGGGLGPLIAAALTSWLPVGHSIALFGGIGSGCFLLYTVFILACRAQAGARAPGAAP